MIKIRKLQNKNSSYLIKFYQSRIYSHANQQVCSQMIQLKDRRFVNYKKTMLKVHIFGQKN
jgi:hypothetical protein